MFNLLSDDFSTITEGIANIDLIVRYIILIAVIAVGIIVLGLIKKASRPISAEKFYEKCTEAEGILSALSASVQDKKYAEWSKELLKAHMIIDKLVYAAALIIENNRDITYEGVKSSFVKIASILDEMNNINISKNILIEKISIALQEIANAKSTIKKISGIKK